MIWAAVSERTEKRMRRILIRLLAGLSLLLALSACGAEAPQQSVPESPSPIEETAAPLPTETEQPQTEKEAPSSTAAEEEESMLTMMIGETEVTVVWEENESVQALRELCETAPLRIAMSMYGGFEQVGAIGTRLPGSDLQTTTAAGDIVLYSGSQFVVFYGSNAWAYTRLGRITDQRAEDLAALLGNGDVTITLQLK